MALDIHANYDSITVIDIPQELISQKLLHIIDGQERYKDTTEQEHMYNASQLLEEFPTAANDIIVELTAINELCGSKGAVYFRIIIY